MKGVSHTIKGVYSLDIKSVAIHLCALLTDLSLSSLSNTLVKHNLLNKMKEIKEATISIQEQKKYAEMIHEIDHLIAYHSSRSTIPVASDTIQNEILDEQQTILNWLHLTDLEVYQLQKEDCFFAMKMIINRIISDQTLSCTMLVENHIYETIMTFVQVNPIDQVRCSMDLREERIQWLLNLLYSSVNLPFDSKTPIGKTPIDNYMYYLIENVTNAINTYSMNMSIIQSGYSTSHLSQFMVPITLKIVPYNVEESSTNYINCYKDTKEDSFCVYKCLSELFDSSSFPSLNQYMEKMLTRRACMSFLLFLIL